VREKANRKGRKGVKFYPKPMRALTSKARAMGIDLNEIYCRLADGRERLQVWITRASRKEPLN
jgi:hypothetical protein